MRRGGRGEGERFLPPPNCMRGRAQLYARSPCSEMSSSVEVSASSSTLRPMVALTTRPAIRGVPGSTGPKAIVTRTPGRPCNPKLFGRAASKPSPRTGRGKRLVDHRRGRSRKTIPPYCRECRRLIERVRRSRTWSSPWRRKNIADSGSENAEQDRTERTAIALLAGVDRDQAAMMPEQDKKHTATVTALWPAAGSITHPGEAASR